MSPSEAEQAFLAHVDGCLPKRCTEGVAAMLAFYRSVRFDRCEPELDGDMLLLQWGTHDWGDGAGFELDITRQLIPDEEDGDTWQLSLTYRFAPSAELRAVGAGNRWCCHPADLVEFQASFSQSEPYQACRGDEQGVVELRYERV